MPNFMGRNLGPLAAATLALSLAGCASKLNAAADDLRGALAGEPVEVTNQSGAVKLTSSADYIFASGGYQLKPGAPVLSKMVPTLSKLRNTEILITGYTDNTPVGPQLQQMGVANNYVLSLKRADAAVQYLQSQGVSPQLLRAKGLGEDYVVAPNSTPECRRRTGASI